VVQSLVADHPTHRKGLGEYHHDMPYIYHAQPIETEENSAVDSGLAMGSDHNNNVCPRMYLFHPTNHLRNGHRIQHEYNLHRFYMILNLSNRIVHI
jgi:hypothetical protein